MNKIINFIYIFHIFAKCQNFSIDEKNRLFFDTRQKWNEKKKNFDNFTFKVGNSIVFRFIFFKLARNQ